MTILSRSKSADVDPDLEHPTWPRGWPDPRSDYFVDPAFREFYRRDPKVDRERMRANLSPMGIPKRVRGKTRYLKPLDGGADEELYLHVAALEAAATDLGKARQRVEYAAKLVKNACRYCGEPGPDLTMASEHTLPSGRVIVNGCTRCNRTADVLDDERTRDGRSRRELVAAALESKGKAS